MKNPCIFVILSVAALGQGASALQATLAAAADCSYG